MSENKHNLNACRQEKLLMCGTLPAEGMKVIRLGVSVTKQGCEKNTTKQGRESLKPARCTRAHCLSAQALNHQVVLSLMLAPLSPSTPRTPNRNCDRTEKTTHVPKSQNLS